jgi:hypothetical protein
MIKRIRYLAGHGLSLMMVLSNFLSRRITPLHSRIHPAWQFTWEGDTAQDFTPEGTTPAILAPTVPCGMPPMTSTSAGDAAASRRQAINANKVQFLSSGQCFLKNLGTQNTEN